jgi:methanol metabolism-related c-type cytochrome
VKTFMNVYATSLLMLAAVVTAPAWADGSGDPAVARTENGASFDKQGFPTFNVKPDGTVDWHTFSGFRRFNGGCEVCHGPDGAGSSFGPALTESLQRLSFPEFQAVVVNGRKNFTAGQALVMPAFGTDENVMCYRDDIFVYLRARSDGVVGRGRPEKHEDKPAAAQQAEDSCMGAGNPPANKS